MCIFQMDMSFISGGITHVIVRTLVIYVFDVLVHGGGGVIGGLRYVNTPPKKLHTSEKATATQKQSSVHF